MKKLLTCTLLVAAGTSLQAQKCLDVNIAGMMKSLSLPANAKSSFAQCTAHKNEDGRNIISDYGKDLDEVDTTFARTARRFGDAIAKSMSGANTQMPSQEDVGAAKDLAAELQSMSPDQQKAFAMKMAQQQRSNSHASSHEPPQVANLVMQTQSIASQMQATNDEYTAKFRALDAAMEKEISAIRKEDKTKCIDKQSGLPKCDCTNKVEGKYWQQALVIIDKYSVKRVALFEEYLGKLRASAATVDKNVASLKYGDGVATANFKNMLLNAQYAAFNAAFIYTRNLMEKVRQSTADAFNNKLNCDANVYEPGCSNR